MKRIAKTSVLLKRVFPVVWFSALLYFPMMQIWHGELSAEFIAVPIALIIIGLLIMKFVIWNLVDEVYDGGDFLLFRNGGNEQKVFLHDITDITYRGFYSPSRVTVTCRKAGQLGKKLNFQGPTKINPVATPDSVQSLIDRVEQAKREQGKQQ